MRFFDKKLSFFLICLCLPLLFLPKINLLKFSQGETAGIRFDDLALLSLAGLLFWAHFALKKRMVPLERWILILTIFSFFSFAMNRILVSMDLLHVNAKIFYCVRFFEYFLFFYIGAMATRFVNISNVMKILFTLNAIIMFLQKKAIIGGMGSEGYRVGDTNRLLGLSSFPSEMGMMLNLLFCFLVFDSKSKSKFLRIFPGEVRYLIDQTYLYWMFILFTVLISYTGNRISVVALIICFLGAWIRDLKTSLTRVKLVLAAVLSCIILSVLILAVSKSAAIVDRSIHLFSFKNIELIQRVWDHIDVNVDLYKKDAVELGKFDASWWMRIQKWCYALKIYSQHPECYLQGVGPGFSSAALDGGFVRILAEYGLIGCFIFWKIFSIMYRTNIQTKWMMISFFICMIFFDVYLSYKAMSLLFFTVGYYQTKQLATSNPTPEYSFRPQEAKLITT